MLILILILLAENDCESKLSQLNVNIDYTYFEINVLIIFSLTLFARFLNFYNNLELLLCKTSFIFSINVININFNRYREICCKYRVLI